MISKIWKKFLLIILIIACLVNIVLKLTHVISFKGTIENIKAKMQIENNIKQNEK